VSWGQQIVSALTGGALVLAGAAMAMVLIWLSRRGGGQ